ncbi:MAG: subclass B3 metallo-beta-lactamase [Betaproteobacteria bacterium]
MLSTILALMLALSAVAPDRADNQPVEPYRIADNLYYVGASDISSYLIVTPAGDILIDAGYTDTVPIIQRNAAKLGFRLEDVRILLNTQAHIDHAAGFARMKALTGAKLEVMGEDATLIEHGGHGDFRWGDTETFPPAKVDRRLEDGDQVRLGGVVLTAHLTPGHTKGCTTWTFTARDRGKDLRVVVVGGTTINPGVRVSGMPTYPTIGRDYAHTFGLLAALPCDIFLGAHRVYYDGASKAEKLRANPKGPNPFVDPDGYRQAVAHWRAAFEKQLAEERK